MKVAVSSTEEGLDARIDPRFGRCTCFTIVDTADMSFVSYSNESNTLGGGAGIDAASFVASKGAKVVLTGKCGPNAMKAFAAAGVSVFDGQTGTVRDAVERFKNGSLTPSAHSAVSKKGEGDTAINAEAVPARGMGRCQGGSGRGMGMGMRKGMVGGRGMGPGMGTGTGVTGSERPIEPTGSRKEILAALEKQVEDLQRQIEALQANIDNSE